MRRFIIKTLSFLVIVAAVFGVVLLNVDGYTDQFYIRFTTPKQDNLILGTSRAAQGVQPKILNEILKKDFFNYSFTAMHSPFGAVYLNSIKKKLNTNIKDGIFIVSVDPWAISNKGDNPNDTTQFREYGLALAKVHSVNTNPNFEYIIKELKGKYYKILTKNGSMFLHNDGWLEVNIAMDSVSVATRLKNKMNDYRKNSLPDCNLSSVRLDYLKQTVEYLKLHGKVYMVRLPVSSEMIEIEQELMPDFNEIIHPIAQIADGYLDMTSENVLQYTDGNHLWKESAGLVSEKIANWIKKLKD